MFGGENLDKKTKKMLAGFLAASFMVASTVTLAGCTSDAALNDDDDDDEPGIVTSSWNAETQQWDHYRSFRGNDYYFGSSTFPHTSTVVSPTMPGVAKSTGPVSVKAMTDGGFGGVHSSVSSARGGIGGGGARASAAS